MADFAVDFTVPQATVVSVSLEIADLARSLQNERFQIEDSDAHYHLKPPWHVESQWREFRSVNRYLPKHVLWFNAVADDAQDSKIDEEIEEKAVVFIIREKNPILIQVSAQCRFDGVADGYSALLRGLAQFGGQTTKEQLLASYSQQRLGELISEGEKREWEELRLGLPGGHVEPPESEDLVGERASAHAIPQEAELQETGPSDASPQYVFRKSGNVWEVAYGECEFHLEHLKGHGLIHELLHRPDYYFHPAELETALEGTATELLGRDGREDLDGVSDGGINQPMVDEQALQEAKEAVEGLKRQLLIANQKGDDLKAKELEDNIEKYEDYLRTSTGKGGKPREFQDDFKRGRVRVTQNIRYAIKAIREHCPPLPTTSRTTSRPEAHSSISYSYRRILGVSSV